MYEKAIALDNSIAMWRLAMLLQKGDVDLKLDPIKAFSLLERASKRGNAAACYALAMCHKRGGDAYGCDRDVKKAFATFERAAKVMHHTAAFFELGLAHSRGDGCEKDDKKAVEYWCVATVILNNFRKCYCHCHGQICVCSLPISNV